MPLTTTAINACNASIWMDKLGGTLTDISGSSNAVNLDFSQEIGMYRTFGSKWPTRLTCGKDARWTLNIVYSSAADEAFDVLKKWFFATNPGNRTVKLYLPDKNVGSDVFSGEFKLESLSWPASAGQAEPINVTAVLLPDGEVTHATNAT